MSERTQHRSGLSALILKAMGIFGGVQMITILCSIVRTKLVSLWIGPLGVGLFGLFNQALEMINTATNLGVRTSSVRDISQAVEEREDSRIARIVTVVRRWSLWLALGGATLTVVCSPLLSRFTFGDFAHTWHFIALALAVAFMALTNGEYAVLQGLSKLRKLATVTVTGSVGGLLISVPLFYFLREKSVIPSIIAYALCLVAAAMITRDKQYQRAKISRRETVQMGAGFIKMGIYMTLGTFVAMIGSYVFVSWLNTYSNTETVGFYQAGYTIIDKYAGLVFTALGMEFYPRLSRVAKSRKRLSVFVSHEINLAFTVLAPLLLALILLRSQVVWLLYSKEFEVIVTYVSWGVVGTILRAASWCMAFVMLARGDGKMFLITESLSAVLGLALNIFCFTRWGVDGLGYAYLAWYVTYVIIIAIVYHAHYHLTLLGNVPVNMLAMLALCIAGVVAMETNLWPVTLALLLLVAPLSLRRLWQIMKN